jgi:class 3 adenylate cyclase
MLCGNSRASCQQRDDAYSADGKYVALDTTASDCQSIEILNGSARLGEHRLIDFGIGLQVGDVTYGNIGIPERLELTVTSAAANEAVRIKALTTDIGVSVVMGRIRGALQRRIKAAGLPRAARRWA